MNSNVKGKMSVKVMTKIAMLSVISFILYFLEMPIPIFPGFLKIDISDLPALIGGFALGPVAGIMIAGIKNALHLLKTTTGGVGELANFIIGSAMIAPSAILYMRSRTKQNAFWGLLIGVVAMSIVGALANYFVLIPFYTNFMPLDVIIQMGTVVNPNITNTFTLVLYAIIPFNLFKGSILTILTMMLYKRISPILNK